MTPFPCREPRTVEELDDANDRGYHLARRGRYDEALQWLIPAAEHGHLTAAYNAGAVYESLGDLENARQWYTVAAELGDLESRTWLKIDRGEDPFP